MKTRTFLSYLTMTAVFPLMAVSCSSCDADHSPGGGGNNDDGITEGVQEELMPFEYSNPLDFSYPYFDGTQDVMKTELRDPCIMRDGDTYYLVYTHFPFTHHDARDASKPDMNSSPGIRLYSSKDLKTWKFENWIVKSGDLPEDCPYKHRFWAPELRKMNGKYYITFYADNWIKDEYNAAGQMGYVGFVGVADKPTGPYEHITWLQGSGCDTHLFCDTDGKFYAVMPFGDIFVQEVDMSGHEGGLLKMIGERRQVVNRDNSDIGLNFSPDYMEGPWMIKRNGKYIIFTGSPYKEEQMPVPNETGLKTGYWVGVAVADNIWGPYTKYPQVFLGGHISVFTGPDGKEWFSYRGETGVAPQQGRLCIDRIPFEEDGSVKPFEPSTSTVVITE